MGRATERTCWQDGNHTGRSHLIQYHGVLSGRTVPAAAAAATAAAASTIATTCAAARISLPVRRIRAARAEWSVRWPTSPADTAPARPAPLSVSASDPDGLQSISPNWRRRSRGRRRRRRRRRRRGTGAATTNCCRICLPAGALSVAQEHFLQLRAAACL